MKSKLLGMALVCLLICSGAMAQVVGWRTDGTGRYTAATPPTEWSTEKNVVWKTAMKTQSNATPVVVGDRIFVCEERATLVCVRASDGEILWQKTHTYLDTVNPAERDKVRQQLEEADIEKTTKDFRSSKNQLNGTRNQLKKAQKKLEETPDDADLKKKIEDLKKKQDNLKKRVEELDAKLKPVAEYIIPVTEGTNGYATPTPVSDGKNVYVLFGTGVAACYDLEGNPKWVKLVQKPTNGWGHSASPVLVGDKLLVHVRSMIALNKDTGEVVWQSKANPRWGTSVHTRIGDVDVVITPNGDIFRVSDGKQLAKNISSLEYATPIVQDGIVYFIEHGGKAFKLPSETSETIAPEFLWQTKPRKERYYGSSVYYGGLIYAVNERGVFSVIDLYTGNVVNEKRLKLGKGTVYPSVALAENYVFVSSDNGTTIVFESGVEPLEVSKNKLEPFRTCPVFRGNRMYIRTKDYLYCIEESAL